MCVSGIMSASRQECKRSYIMCLAVSCPHQDRNVSGHTLCVLAVSCPHQDRNVSGHTLCVLAVSCPHQDRNVSGHTYVC